MKARKLAFALFICCALCACAGPSLRYKKSVNDLLERSKFAAAAEKIEANKNKEYGQRDELLYLLDLSAAQNAAHNNEASNKSLAAAQDKIEELFAKSVTKTLGTLIVNDYTQPYRPPVFETALTYFMRAVDYLSMNGKNDAAVEARKAVFYLDNMRRAGKSGYHDDPFVQYFASMIFEDGDNLSSARIARTNALNAYQEYKSFSSADAPDFPLPANYSDKGEAVIFHFNGKAPYKISRQIMFAWNNIWFALQGNDDLKGVSQDVINAVFAGAFGRSISVSFAEFIDNSYIISSSSAFAADGREIKTQLVSDISSAAKKTLKDETAADTARMLTRAVTKYILSVQARHMASKISKNESVGQLTGILFSALSNITEKADTRSWFTLPAEIRMASLFLPPGKHNIKLVMHDNSGKTIDEHLFENVQINKGERTYLYHRSAK